ncbi:MAG: cardiolipin synthase [Lachnospiraceae bacterium]|nr:cardiolipin synthase [Lachnospiraceae bacterium]
MEQAAMAWSWMMEHLLYINLVLSIVIVFFQRRDPKAVWTWLLLLYFIPVFGFFFYLIFAQDYHKSKMFRIKEVEDRLSASARQQERILKNDALYLEDPLAADYGDLVCYNLEQAGSVLTLENQVEIFTDGEEKFEDLRRELAEAKHFIHIQYYIIKDDELFGSMIPILKERAGHGVEVRILYDGMGGRFIPRHRWQELEKEGIRLACFFPPFLGRLNFRINYRNHRKIVVIDGRVGYVGGFNIGREYLGKNPRMGYWRDTHLKITGDAVISLQIRFALDWNYAGKENLFLNGWYFMDCGQVAKEGMPKPEGRVVSEETVAEESKDRGSFVMKGKENPKFGIPARPFTKRLIGIQIIASGPDSMRRQIRDNYLQLFHKARHHIYIQTPYFVPDDAILSALKIAAGSGIDVRLMIPCKPDHLFVYWATYSYVGELVFAGARCYTYENGFLHAKGVMVDSRVSCYGTANMDIRSFELNFEVNATIFDEETTEQLETVFLDDLVHCREVTREIYESRNLWVRIREQGSRLLSPLL